MSLVPNWLKPSKSKDSHKELSVTQTALGTNNWDVALGLTQNPSVQPEGPIVLVGKHLVNQVVKMAFRSTVMLTITTPLEITNVASYKDILGDWVDGYNGNPYMESIYFSLYLFAICNAQHVRAGGMTRITGYFSGLVRWETIGSAIWTKSKWYYEYSRTLVSGSNRVVISATFELDQSNRDGTPIPDFFSVSADPKDITSLKDALSSINFFLNGPKHAEMSNRVKFIRTDDNVVIIHIPTQKTIVEDGPIKIE